MYIVSDTYKDANGQNMARLLNKDPVLYVEERGRFIKELRQFHQNKG